MQFLQGLNEQYNNIKSHVLVLLMDPIPPVTRIFSFVAQRKEPPMSLLLTPIT